MVVTEEDSDEDEGVVLEDDDPTVYQFHCVLSDQPSIAPQAADAPTLKAADAPTPQTAESPTPQAADALTLQAGNEPTPQAAESPTP